MFNGQGTTKQTDEGLIGEEPNLYYSAKTSAGVHSHTIGRGGDRETRPVNVAVHWIIKFKDIRDRHLSKGEH
jgi:hypothetical protein